MRGARLQSIIIAIDRKTGWPLSKGANVSRLSTLRSDESMTDRGATCLARHSWRTSAVCDIAINTSEITPLVHILDRHASFL